MISTILKPVINIISFGINVYKKHVKIKKRNKDFKTMAELEKIIDNNNNQLDSSDKKPDLEDDINKMKSMFNRKNKNQ